MSIYIKVNYWGCHMHVGKCIRDMFVCTVLINFAQIILIQNWVSYFCFPAVQSANGSRHSSDWKIVSCAWDWEIFLASTQEGNQLKDQAKQANGQSFSTGYGLTKAITKMHCPSCIDLWQSIIPKKKPSRKIGESCDVSIIE